MYFTETAMDPVWVLTASHVTRVPDVSVKPVVTFRSYIDSQHLSCFFLKASIKFSPSKIMSGGFFLATWETACFSPGRMISYLPVIIFSDHKGPPEQPRTRLDLCGNSTYRLHIRIAGQKRSRVS